MGTTSPMSRSVHSLVLSYLTRSFSASSSSSSLLNVAHQAIARPTTDEDNRDTNDATARLYLSIVMGQPELVVRNTSSLLHAPPSLDVSHLLLYRGIALATTGSKDEAHVTFTQVHDMLDSLSSAETSEAVQTARVRALHNVGCVLDQHGSTEEALSTWKQALALAGQEKEGSNESATLTKCQVELLCNIGTLHTEQGDPNEGILCLSRAVAMLGATQNLEMVRPLTLLGRAHHADGRAVSAEGYFRSALGLLEEQNSTSAGPSMQVQHIETLRMYGSLLMDWEQRKTDYDLHMDRSNEIHQLLKDNGIVAMPTGLSLPLPNLGERRDL
jgi:tetratricopeptide (TPR) repeat protein